MLKEKKKPVIITELILLIATLGAIVLLGIIFFDPAQTFSESRNLNRSEHLKFLANALDEYKDEHAGNLPLSITSDLQMIGTAKHGCSIACGIDTSESVKSSEFSDAESWLNPDGVITPNGQWDNGIKAIDNDSTTYAANVFGKTGWGEFIYFTLEYPLLSDRIRIMADYLDVDIAEVQVDILKDGNWATVFQGGKESEWNAIWIEIPFASGQVRQARFRYNYKTQENHYWVYDFQFHSDTSKGTLAQSDITQTGTSNLVATDTSSSWLNPKNAVDNYTNTYASHYHAPNPEQWSSYLYFDQDPIYTNSIIFNARGLNEVDRAQIEILINNEWLMVYDSAFSNAQDVKVPFAEAEISQARIRFHAKEQLSGFFFQLFELKFLESSMATRESCLDLAELTPDYLATMPYDPVLGDSEKSYYAIKKLQNEQFIIYACKPELEVEIWVAR